MSDCCNLVFLINILFHHQKKQKKQTVSAFRISVGAHFLSIKSVWESTHYAACTNTKLVYSWWFTFSSTDECLWVWADLLSKLPCVSTHCNVYDVLSTSFLQIFKKQMQTLTFFRGEDYLREWNDKLCQTQTKLFLRFRGRLVCSTIRSMDKLMSLVFTRARGD